MRCPNCGHESNDPEAIFCPRCGTSLGPTEVEATTELDAEAVAATEAETSSTTELRTPVVEDPPAPDSPSAGGPPPPPPPPPKPLPTAEPPAAETPAPETPAPETPAPETPAPHASQEPVAEQPSRGLIGGLGNRIPSSWFDVTAAACLAFLVLMFIGGVLLLGAKLQFPALGVGANAIDVLTAIAIIALGILRAPIHLGNVTVTVLPLGALIAAALGMLWAARLAVRDLDRARPLFTGVRFAIPFAIICWLASLSFRFRGREEVFAGAWGTFLWALVWGAVFGAVATIVGDAPLWATLRAKVWPKRSTGERAIGMRAALVMLATAAVLSAFALVLWVIVGLIRGTPTPGFGLGDALAALVYLLAFAPNVLGIITAVGMGSALDVGARVTIAKSRVGRINEISIFSWGGDSPPAYVFLLLVVPLAATVAGGYYARRTASGERMLPTLAWAAVTFAVVLFLIALLGDARLGGGLAGFGVAHVSVHAFRTLLLALVWGFGGGALGWWVAQLRTPKSKEVA
jgi:hypothetical protein